MRQATGALLMACALLISSCSRRAPVVAPVTAPAPPPEIMLPAGTNISLRTVTRIDSGASAAEGFPAVLVGTLRDPAGNDLVTPGAPTRLTLHPADGLTLAAIMVYGTWHTVNPAAAQAEAVGGGAPLGMLVRGVVEPQAGHVDQSMTIVTTGRDVQVPAGSLLMFRLSHAARIR